MITYQLTIPWLHTQTHTHITMLIMTLSTQSCVIGLCDVAKPINTHHLLGGGGLLHVQTPLISLASSWLNFLVCDLQNLGPNSQVSATSMVSICISVLTQTLLRAWLALPCNNSLSSLPGTRSSVLLKYHFESTQTCTRTWLAKYSKSLYPILLK